MRFVVYGAGAVGGVVGGRLYEHGHDVLLVARGAHYEAIRAVGLRVESGEGTATLPVPVVDDPAAARLGPDDVVLLAMKSQDTAAALDALAPVAPPGVPIVCVQNGVDNERMALRLFERVYGVCTMCPTSHLEPGVVQAYSAPTSGILDIGRFPHGVDETAEEIASTFKASTFESIARPDIARWKYAKLLMNLGNAIEALCGQAARGGRINELARAEGVACLDAAGIAYASREEDRQRRGDILSHRPIDGRPRSGASSWQSLARRTGSIETDYLNGEIVMLGRLRGVATPVNELLQRLAGDVARRRDPPGSMSEDDFFRLLADQAPLP